MNKTLMVVGSNVSSAEQEAEFNDWYTNQHLDDVIGVEGIISATRYGLSSVRPLAETEESSFRYLALYEIETDDLESLSKNLQEALADGRIPVTDSIEIVTVDFFTPLPGAARPS